MFRDDLSFIPTYKPGKSDPQLLKLASNESAEQPLPSVLNSIEKAATHVNRYPYMAESPLQATIARFHGVADDQIALGCGSSAVLQQLILACCQDGDEVVFPWRSFEAYPILTRVAGAVPVQVPLTAELGHDFEAMLAAITDRTRVVMVCNPNNPTGTIARPEEIENFLSQVPADVVVCLDEAYIDYLPADLRPDSLRLLSERPNVCIARTFSKVYGLAGLRVGYMIGSAELIAAVGKTSIPFSVNSLAHDAALSSLAAQDEKEARVRETGQQRSRVHSYLRDEFRSPKRWNLADNDIPETYTNFVWLNLGASSEDFAAQLLDQGIIARCFPGEGVRITVTNEAETDTLINALRAIASPEEV